MQRGLLYCCIANQTAVGKVCLDRHGVIAAGVLALLDPCIPLDPFSPDPHPCLCSLRAGHCTFCSPVLCSEV